SSRFAANSTAKVLIPVMLPPGWARLATRPSLTGSSPLLKDDEDRRGHRPGRERRTSSKCCDHGDPLVKEFGCQYRQSIPLTLRPTVYAPPVLALDVAAVL